MNMNELIQKNIKPANDYNELLQENIKLARESKKLNYDNNVLRGAYETRLARYNALEKKLNECYGMYATLKKHYNDLQDRYYESYEDLQDKYNELQDKYNELQNSFEESQDDLASANTANQIYHASYNETTNQLLKKIKEVATLKEELAATTELYLSYKKDAEELASTQDDLAAAGVLIKDRCKVVKELREELRQMRIRLDEVEEARDNWKAEAIRRQNELNNIEMRNLMREKPAQECCSHCDKTDCSDCPICPF